MYELLLLYSAIILACPLFIYLVVYTRFTIFFKTFLRNYLLFSRILLVSPLVLSTIFFFLFSFPFIQPSIYLKFMNFYKYEDRQNLFISFLIIALNFFLRALQFFMFFFLPFFCSCFSFGLPFLFSKSLGPAYLHSFYISISVIIVQLIL